MWMLKLPDRRRFLSRLRPLSSLVLLGLTASSSSLSAQETHIADHLVISEVAYDAISESGGGTGEYIEIHNPTNTAVLLNEGAVPGLANGRGSYFISDSSSDASADAHTGYFNVVNGKVSFGSTTTDGVFQFPIGAIIPAHGTLVVCSDSDKFLGDYFDGSLEAFQNLPGRPQLFETTQDGLEDGVPDMLTPSSYQGVGDPVYPMILTNSGEPAILFYWDGESDLVKDVDIVVWKRASYVVDKTGISIDGPDGDGNPSTYEPDAAQAVSLAGSAPASNTYSLQRMNVVEQNEADAGGNGITGQDETSEQWGSISGAANPTWAYLPYTPGTPYIALDASLDDALSFLPPVATSPADGPGAGLIADYGADGTLTELYLSLVDSSGDRVGDSLYVAVRGAMFGEPDETANASFVLVDFDPGSGTGVTVIAGDGNELEDTSGTLDRRLTFAGFSLDSTSFMGLGFDGALGIDAADPTNDTAGWRTFGTGGTAGTYSAFAYSGDDSNVNFVGDVDPIFPGAPGTTLAGRDGFESLIPLSTLVPNVPDYLFVVAVTTADSDANASPNTLPESSNDFFTYPQVLDKGVCFSTATGQAVTFYVDADGDGYGSATESSYCGPPTTGYALETGDCDDTVAEANPAGTEVCDGIDNDCNDEIDEGVKTVFYLDEDGDGYGQTDSATEACEAPADYAQAPDDCNDQDPEINPAADEVCDGIDNDCNDEIDDGLPSYTVYVDEDRDGYGTGDPATDCMVADGYSETPGDCDDSLPDVNPGQLEACDGLDTDCDGILPADELDNDGDGYKSCGGDCDDTRADINPAAEEVCDGRDTDCDGTLPAEENDEDFDGYEICAGDCDDTSAIVYSGAEEQCDGLDNDCDTEIDEGVTQSFFVDNDGDGFGGSDTQEACALETGLADNDLDCNDGDGSIHPDADETCDGIDNNCNGETDEGVLETFFMDADEDGFGDPGVSTTACAPPDGYSAEGTDCDDASPITYPGAEEACDAQDNDCDGSLALEEQDADGDGYIGCGTTSDCDDSDPATYPGADEVCDGVDNDCDSILPEEETDADGDGVPLCLDDCDDADPNVYPGAIEACNGQDDDCDPDTDETIDNDGDGHAACPGDDGLADCDDTDPAINPEATEACDGIDNDCDPETDELGDRDGDGYTICDGDCDDTSAIAYPGAEETCNGTDDNCDGEVDEGFVSDADGDGYAGTQCLGDDCNDDDATIYPGAHDIPEDGIDQDCDGIDPVLEDADGDGYTNDVDCDDTDPGVHPGAEEDCDGIDTDCDGEIPSSESDGDGDGWAACDGDCDDTNPDVHPDAVEVCNGVDDDCNADTDESTFDGDGDGYALCDDCDDANPDIHPGALETCNGVDDDCDATTVEDADGDGDGYSACDGDCDDTDPAISPSATESCNGLDDNCDGQVDEGFSPDADGDGEMGPECGGSDCDDGDATVYPGADEIPGDGIDQDCDGQDASAGDDDDATSGDDDASPPEEVSPTPAGGDSTGCQCSQPRQHGPVPAGILLLGAVGSATMILRARRR